MKQSAIYQLSGKQILVIAFSSALIAAGTVACFSGFSNGFGNQNTNVARAEETLENVEKTTEISDPATVSDEQNNIEVYKTKSPGVAFITTSQKVEDWFGEEHEQERGNGSGSVIDTEGHIVTNAHVVEGASKVTVSFGGSKIFPAKVIGTDMDTDLAVIKVEAPKEALTIIPFGDSDKLIVGQKVIAIGNPFGLDRTLTTGVISGLQRPIRARNGRPIEGAVQTDASINPGNSGGPLLNKYGQMIGINSQILSPAGGSVGVGFAIPVSIAKRVVPQLIQFGEVRRAKLGIGSRNVSDLLKQGIKLPTTEGLLIINVGAGSAAEKAGLRGVSQDNRNGEIILGDTILTIDGEKINDQDTLYRALDKKQIGDTIQVEIFRDNKKQTVPVKLTALANQIQPNRPNTPRRF
jgi:S1-C subfamily serine protease